LKLLVFARLRQAKTKNIIWTTRNLDAKSDAYTLERKRPVE
jgi:hypothetical protein